MVRTVVAIVEGSLVASRGENWRIEPTLREELVRTNAHVLELYLPGGLDHPVLAAALPWAIWLGGAYLTEPKIPNDGTPEERADGGGALTGANSPGGPAFVSS